MKNILALLMLLLFCWGCSMNESDISEESGQMIQNSEFVFTKDEVPFPSCHASTIAEIPGGLVVAWFGGTHEKHQDVGIWLSRNTGEGWSEPVEIANGVIDADTRYPSWNPVLYYEDSKLVLFYKVGPNCADWWGERKISEDLGKTWSQALRFPEDIWGPIRNKPVKLDDGSLLCPSSTEYDGWRVHMEFTDDLGETWQRTEALNHRDSLSAIQPTILRHPQGHLQMLCRTKNNRIYTSWSDDQGKTWSKLVPTALPNNNSGIDAVTLMDGRHLLVYNHIDRSVSDDKRNRLNIAISEDGKNWKAVTLLENDDNAEHEYSYPAVIQSEDGKVHITYTWRRELIKHVVLNVSNIEPKPIKDGVWPKEL